MSLLRKVFYVASALLLRDLLRVDCEQPLFLLLVSFPINLHNIDWVPRVKDFRNKKPTTRSLCCARDKLDNRPIPAEMELGNSLGNKNHPLNIIFDVLFCCVWHTSVARCFQTCPVCWDPHPSLSGSRTSPCCRNTLQRMLGIHRSRHNLLKTASVRQVTERTLLNAKLTRIASERQYQWSPGFLEVVSY